MIPIEYIIAFSMAITNIIKKRLSDKNSDFTPLIAFTIAISLNIINALIFGGSVRESFSSGFVSAGISLALFSGGTSISRIITPPKI